MKKPQAPMGIKRHVDTYLLDQLHAEICERQKTRVDDRTKFVYDRAREFYWTISRLTRSLGESFGSQHPVAPARARPCRKAPSEDIAVGLERPRLLIDVTPTHRCDIGTGIQRVVREVAKAATVSGEGIVVFIEDGQLFPFFDHPSLPAKIEIAEGDKYLMLDAAWAHLDEYRPMMDTVSRKGGENIVCVYDIMPLLYPASFRIDFRRVFEAWLEELVCASDAVVAISQTVAREFREFAVASGRTIKSGQRLGWWMLGADFGCDRKLSPSERAASICASSRPMFLSVGTLAPTKGQSMSLCAFEKLWGAGVDVSFVIIGKRSWNTKALEKRLETHSELGRRLFWLEDADDDELRFVYRHAHGVVCASFTEGYGLPLVEAAHNGAPVIASDIPIFRELGGEELVYFDALDCDALAKCVEDVIARPKSTLKLSAPSWRESAHALTQMIRQDAYQI